MAREKTERLLNLMIALSSSARPVSREELRQWLLDQYGNEQSPEAFEKMFERDKDELRGMGIPIETVVNAHNEVVGYRIDSSRLKLGQLDFNASEIAVLNTAAALWSSASASSPTRSAILKIEASSGVLLKDSPLVAAVGAQFPEGMLGVLLQAVSEHRVVDFDYQKADGSRARRSIAAWAVLCREGHWYLVGLDQDRNESRVFRLSRIVGSITLGPLTPSRPPADIDVSSLIGAQESRLRVQVHVEPGMALALRQRAGVDSATTSFDLEYDNVNLLFRELLHFAPAVYVQSPDNIRAAFIEHLEGVGGELT